MKRVVLLYLCLSSTLVFAVSKDYDISFKQVSAQSSEITFNLSDYRIDEVVLEGQLFIKVNLQSSLTTNQKGFAELPIVSRAVQLSPQKNADLVIKNVEYQDYQLDNPLLPSKGIIYRSEKLDDVIYAIEPESLIDNWYPSEIAKNTDPYIIKDMRGVSIQICPFRYNAKKNILRVYTHINLELVENNDTPINPLFPTNSSISSDLQSIYKSTFLNNTPVSKLSKSSMLAVQQLGDILVITTPRDEDAIEPYIQWKKEKGFNVYKEVVTAGTNVTNLIQQTYDENNNILYVQLVGDWEDIQGYADSVSNSPQDPKLGCVVGNDDYPDICIGRFSGNSIEDIAVQVNKVIQYEKNTVADDSWLATATGIASNNGRGDDCELDYEHQDVIWHDKLNTFTFDNYNNIYDPSAAKEMVTNAINDGTSLINYTGHGDINGWHTSAFNVDDIAELDNDNKLPLIISVACNNGLFNTNGDCFAESWLKKENGGAISMLAASINLPWASSMRGQDYFMDVLSGGYNYDEHTDQYGINTSDQRTILGSIIFNGFILMLSEMSGYTDIETVHSWNLFGDASMQIRTSAPKAIDLSNKMVRIDFPFETTVFIEKPLENAVITISQEGKFYSGTSNTDGHVYIEHDLHPGKAKLVVTAFNTETIYQDIFVTDETELPAYIMDNNIFECEHGIFLDNGGLNGDYDSSENSIMTFFPLDARTMIKVMFQSFDVDSSDRLYVYDGTGINASEISGSPFYGLNAPDQIAADNPSGALTFHFVSDSSINAEGWSAEIISSVVSSIDNYPTGQLNEFKLYPNYPNPFNPNTTIRYQISEESRVKIVLYNILGQEIRLLAEKVDLPGRYNIQWDGRNNSGMMMPGGVYFLSLSAGRYKDTLKLLLMK